MDVDYIKSNILKKFCSCAELSTSQTLQIRQYLSSCTSAQLLEIDAQVDSLGAYMVLNTCKDIIGI